MYNYGLLRFLKAKQVKPSEAIHLFLQNENITDFKPKNHNRVNDYIQNNWVKFSSFVDKSIKDGILKGKPVKLNTYFQEQHERNQVVIGEFKSVTLTAQEKKIIMLENWQLGAVHSFFSKNNIDIPKRDESFTSKKLQKMPIIEVLRKHSLVSECVDYINNYDDDKHSRKATKERLKDK